MSKQPNKKTGWVIHIRTGRTNVVRLITGAKRINQTISLVSKRKTFGDKAGQGYLCHPKK